MPHKHTNTQAQIPARAYAAAHAVAPHQRAPGWLVGGGVLWHEGCDSQEDAKALYDSERSAERIHMIMFSAQADRRGRTNFSGLFLFSSLLNVTSSPKTTPPKVTSRLSADVSVK